VAITMLHPDFGDEALLIAGEAADAAPADGIEIHETSSFPTTSAWRSARSRS